MSVFDLIIIGGGAAGFFAALAAKEGKSDASVLVLEKSSQLLTKVRVSGGGRCNVTHACFDPMQLVKNYPRGNKALISPFTRFQPNDTINWFKARGVQLKIEEDGRMFPITDNSQTIIDCLQSEARKMKVDIRTKQTVESIQCDGRFCLKMASGDILECKSLLLATGSSPQGHLLAQSLGHTIQPPVPSLFTFNVPNSSLKGLEGIAVESAEIRIMDSTLSQVGPLLITHWGFSGPAALKLSAWGARLLHEKNYKVQIAINWIPNLSLNDLINRLKQERQHQPSQTIGNCNPFTLPKNLWRRLLEVISIDHQKRLSEMSNETLSTIAQKLHADIYQVDGKTTYKEEFVTCGGVSLNEVDFKTMESRLCPHLYFAGEVLDIDAVTGGFNFQNAWTTGWIAGHAAMDLE